MLTIGHRITVGDAVYSSAEHSRLRALVSDASLSVPVNAARIVLGPPEGISVALDDDVTVELGLQGEEELVFTGTVASFDVGLDHVTIHAEGAFRRLVSERFNLLYEKSTAGDIVTDVAGRVDVQTGTVESGPDFPSYALGAERTAYEQLESLARFSGFDLFADTEDQLVFAAWAGEETHECVYGVNVLSLERVAHEPRASGVEVFGESPASHGEGAEAASWLTTQEVKGSAGDDSLRFERHALAAARTLEAAGAIAESLLLRASRAEGGRVSVVGNALVRLGDAVELVDLPDGDANGTFKVTGVRHRLDARRGFVTDVAWEAT